MLQTDRELLRNENKVAIIIFVYTWVNNRRRNGPFLNLSKADTPYNLNSHEIAFLLVILLTNQNKVQK